VIKINTMKKANLYKGIAASILSIIGFIATGSKRHLAHPSSGAFIAPGGSIIGVVTNLTTGFDTVETGRDIVYLVRTTSMGHVQLATLYTGTTTTSKKIYH